ncbi:MAG: rRNA maturation RNase YbeY [Patescibacteria group bacterium]|nr:rRNA maturation RNase YbeY [Patescibacteria group bacterium]
MSQVFIGYDNHGIDGVDDDCIRFIFDVVLGSLKRDMNLEVGLVIADEKKMQDLNKKYCGKDKPTNVLSFTNSEIPDLADNPELQDKNYLGDVYICYQILLDEAKTMKISNRERFSQLFVHGLLHLNGFDHEDPSETKKMEEMEDKICELIL